MSQSASKEAMNDLHAAVAEELRGRIESGEASAADISNAIKFLKDNGIEADPGTNPGLTSLAKRFPDFSQDENEPGLVN